MVLDSLSYLILERNKFMKKEEAQFIERKKITLATIDSADDYFKMVLKFTNAVEYELSYIEEIYLKKNNFDFVHRMPIIISMVNMVGYLRGMDGSFEHIYTELEPDTNVYTFGGEKYTNHIEDSKRANISIFHKNERELKLRLGKIIDSVLDSEKRDEYEVALKEYFVDYNLKKNNIR